MLQGSLQKIDFQLGPEHADALLSMDNRTIRWRKRAAEAEKLCRETAGDSPPRALLRHPDTATSGYEFAGLQARQGRRNDALSTLKEAIDHGLAAETVLDLVKEEDFKSLHGGPQFEALVAHAKERATA